MVKGIIGHKRVRLEVDLDGTPTWTEISSMVNVQAPGMEREEAELTTLDDDDMNYDVTGPVDRGEVTGAQRWIPGDTNHELLDQYAEDNEAKLFRLVFVIDPATSPTGDRIGEFTAKVRQLAPQVQGRADFLQRDVILRLLSKVTWSTT